MDVVVKLTREPKLSAPQPGASSSDDATVQSKTSALRLGQPVPTHSFVSMAESQVSISIAKPAGLANE